MSDTSVTLRECCQTWSDASHKRGCTEETFVGHAEMNGMGGVDTTGTSTEAPDASNVHGTTTNLPYVYPVQKGWECPKCGRVYAPGVAQCFYCGQKTTPWVDPYHPWRPSTYQTAPQPIYC